MKLIKIKLCKNSCHDQAIESMYFFLVGESKVFFPKLKFRSYQYLTVIDPLRIYRRNPFSVKVKSYREVHQNPQGL